MMIVPLPARTRTRATEVLRRPVPRQSLIFDTLASAIVYLPQCRECAAVVMMSWWFGCGFEAVIPGRDYLTLTVISLIASSFGCGSWAWCGCLSPT